LRKTNKFWKEELDRAFENQEDPELKPDIKMRISAVAQVDQLLETAEENVNPFWVRQLEFRFPPYSTQEDQQDRLDYWASVTHLLERFGHYVNGMAVSFSPHDVNEETIEFDETLARILHATQNVRSLKIYGGIYHDLRVYGRVDLRHYFRANLNQLPELPHLRYLSLYFDMIEWTGRLLSKLVADPTQLKGLSLTSLYEAQPSEEVVLALRSFTSLKRLNIVGGLVELFQYLGSVATSRPPLERIELLLHEDVDNELDGAVFREVLQMLNSFGDSLKTLGLDVMGKKIPDGFNQGFPLPGVRLSKLQHIDLCSCQRVLEMVLLIEAPLKTLRMDLPNPLNENHFAYGHLDWRALGHFGSTLQELDVSGVGRGMNEHDFYELTINLPNLRVIKFQDIHIETLEHLFRLSSLKRLESFHVEFEWRVPLEDSTRGFELVDRKIDGKPSIWEEMPFLQEFSLKGEIRDEDDGNPRARREKVVTCVRGKPVQITLLDRRYRVW